MNVRRSSWSLAALLLALALLAACSSSGGSTKDDEKDTGGGGTPSCLNTGNGVDTITLASSSYTEGQSGLATASGVTGLCDPLIDAYVLTNMYVDFIRGFLSASTATEELYFGGNAVTGSQTTTWFLDYYNSSGAECQGQFGTLNTTALGANGGRMIGTFQIDSWIVWSGTCPTTPFSGSFNGTRNDTAAFSTGE